MRAMLNQFDPITVLTRFNRIAAASREVVATDIPPSEVGTMIDLALKAKALPVSSVAIMPPLINPSSPDFDRARSAVQKKIETSEAIDTGAAEATPAGGPDATPESKSTASTPKPKPTASTSRDAQTDDLGEVCSA
jgi:polyisoprenyl-teichoic acid--peptidoglycan teichoic acid transferase